MQVMESHDESPVLIIEDDPFLSDMLSSALTEAHIPVVHAADAEKGLAILAEQKVRIVLLDIILPGIDGYEFLKRIKSDPKTAPIPVFVLSNLGQKDEVERALSMGAEEFMVKAQLDLSEIVTRVKEILSKDTPQTAP